MCTLSNGSQLPLIIIIPFFPSPLHARHAPFRSLLLPPSTSQPPYLPADIVSGTSGDRQQQPYQNKWRSH